MNEYYFSKGGVISRQQNTVVYQNEEGQKRRLPVHTIKALHMGSGISLNTDTLAFLNKSGIDLHFYNYKMDYRCSMCDPMGSGDVTVMQVEHMSDPARRLGIASMMLSTGFSVMSHISGLREPSMDVDGISQLMGVEGSFRKKYYETVFGSLPGEWKFTHRTKRPPKDQINCLISFFNMLCYSVCQSAISSTQLNSNISFLHSSYGSRQSLRLDVAEIFKPAMVDLLILRIVQENLLTEIDFDKAPGVCLLNTEGKRKCYALWDENINQTFFYPSLKRNISYKTLIKIECNKLVKHLLGIKLYEQTDLNKIIFKK